MMKTNTFKRGFTLIELLVVIAIIGILASVVLASLNSARSKGEDAAIKSNLNNIRAQAELVYDNANGSYDNVCTDTNVTNAVNAAGGGCVDSATRWIAGAPLNTTPVTLYCVDYTGFATVTAATTFAGEDGDFACDGNDT